jgi:WD40 repeat protein
LTKDPANRLHDIADVRIELAKALAQPAVSSRQDHRPFIAAVAVAVVSAAVAIWSLMHTPEPPALPVVRTVLPLPEGESLLGPLIAISPDGPYVAYIANEGSPRLYLRRIDDLDAQPIEGSEGADTPFFSDDNEWVGCVAGDRAVLRAAVSGGAPLRVSEIHGYSVGLDWHGDSIVQGSLSDGLFRIPAAGGEREVLTVLHPERGEKSHRIPQVLPGGDAVLFTVGTSTMELWDDASIAVASMKTGEYKVILEGGFQARYSPTGHLIFARGETLFAVTFDRKRLEVTGQPVPVLRGVITDRFYGGGAFALGENGSLVYAPGHSRTRDVRVVWVDRDGRVEPLVETPRPFFNLDLSPDGRVLALETLAANNSIWLYEIDRGTLTRWTSEWDNSLPVWAPSGREIAFNSTRMGATHLYKRGLDVGGKEELLATSERNRIPTSWSPDGSVLLFDEYSAETGADIWMLPLSGEREPEPLLNGRADERWAEFSPDGEWIAYESDETGRSEIYVRRFPSGEMRQVSTGGGDHPIWHPNGKELFYSSGDKMMAVAVETEGKLFLGHASVLFVRRRSNPISANFTITRDGKRFIFIDDSVADLAPTHLVLVQNFGEELKRLVPVRN